MNRHRKYVESCSGRGFIMSDEKLAKGKPFQKGEAGMSSFECMHEEPLPRGLLKYYEYLLKMRR